MNCFQVCIFLVFTFATLTFGHEDDDGPASYKFEYGVHDPKTGDKKFHTENRDGHVVKGSYSLDEPDGTKRIVEYTADKKNGFQAVVKRIGDASHPAHYAKGSEQTAGDAESHVGKTHWGSN
ncbi:adult-specific cuticular protein ACP-20-like [Agrilus planipennis]|uniref:Adult-specific cuticular protein ACP-20-like n=1 Tax=Agrilus planipennis TaxID=224129 RepID=A0A1W4WRQ7_AGRPL|nr:adult-specific cuticular protein ACP-20-like [Agrilus planipennis]